MATTDFREIGNTGLQKTNGVIREEYLRELQGSRWNKIRREMQDDAIVGGTLLAIVLSLRQVEREVEPADDSPAAAEVAEFFEGCFEDMSSTWADTQSDILSMLPNGFSYFELVYKRRVGDSNDSSKRSKFSDGRIGWRKWGLRDADSLDHWEFDETGGLQGMWQVRDNGAPVLIPIEKALLFRTTSHKGNPEGKSILRAAYRPYYMKRNIENVEAIGVERNLDGVPVIYADGKIMGDGATTGERAFFELLKQIVVNLRNDEQAGLVLPSLYDDKGNRLYELVLLSSTGQATHDTNAIITRYGTQMAMSMLADFIMLGHEAVGSYALSATKSSLFKTALEAWLQAIADVINTHAIPRLMRLNGMAMELAPRVCFGSVGEVELIDVTTFLTAAFGAGMTLFPDMELENHLRSEMGWPMLDEEAFAEREAAKQAEKEADRAAKAKQPVGSSDNASMSNAEMHDTLEAAMRILARGH